MPARTLDHAGDNNPGGNALRVVGALPG